MSTFVKYDYDCSPYCRAHIMFPLPILTTCWRKNYCCHCSKWYFSINLKPRMCYLSEVCMCFWFSLKEVKFGLQACSDTDVPWLIHCIFYALWAVSSSENYSHTLQLDSSAGRAQMTGWKGSMSFQWKWWLKIEVCDTDIPHVQYYICACHKHMPDAACFSPTWCQVRSYVRR